MIKHLPELPKEGSQVFAAKGIIEGSCIFIARKFLNKSYVKKLKIGGADEISGVTKWFYLNEYQKYFIKNYIADYTISFRIAEYIEYIFQLEDILKVLSDTEDRCIGEEYYPGTGIRDNVTDMENKLYDLKHKLEEKINASK